MKLDSNKDYEVKEILNEIGDIYIPKNTRNFKVDYLNGMKDLIKKIRENLYPKTNDKEQRKEIINNLYTLGIMFYCYASKMNQYRKKFDTNIEFVSFIARIPTCHNYYRYLPYLTPEIFDKYYLRQIDCFEDFVENNGEILPKYLYEIIDSEKGYFYINKLQYFSGKDFPFDTRQNHYLPAYFIIEGKRQVIETYNDYLTKGEISQDWYDDFLKEQWPCICHINNTLFVDNMHKIKRFNFTSQKTNICHYIADIDEGDEININDIIYKTGLQKDEICKILDNEIVKLAKKQNDKYIKQKKQE